MACCCLPGEVYTNAALDTNSSWPNSPCIHTNMSTVETFVGPSGDGKVEHVEEHHTSPPPAVKTTGWMIFFAIFIGLAGFQIGFDTGFSGLVLAMAPFNEAFGTCVHLPTGKTICLLSATRQSVISIYQLLAVVGSILAAITSKYIGRRGALQAGCLWVAVGAAGMLGTSGNFAGYMVCHSIEAIGLGHFVAMAPVYGVECVAPQTRGILVSLYAVGTSIGVIVIGGVCLRSSTYKSDWAWKTPIICEIPIAVLYGLGLMMFKESPRWLMLKGKEEEARKSFGSFYNMDPFSEAITAQIHQVRAAIEYERAISDTTSWTEIFHRKNIRRTIIACLINTLASVTGIFFIVVYGALYLHGLGYKNPFVINIIFAVCLFSGTIFSPWVLEYVGRRVSLLAGYSAMAICMLVFSAVSSGEGASNPSAKNVLVAFLCLWSVSYGATISNTQWVASSEMHSVRLRTYGQSFSAGLGQITAFASAFWTPYMINPDYGNMGTNVGYFYAGLTVLVVIVTFFMVPETGRLSLEAIDDIFATYRPAWKTSLKGNKRIAKGQDVDTAEDIQEFADQKL